MTPGVKFAAHTDSAYELMDKFLGLRLRHLLGLRLRHLLVDKKGEFIGLLSVVDVMRTALQEKTREFEELHTVATWEYYEEWRPRQ
jgi:signal-transduction protein with cAMP-binding, CBS, and nucleotidyltransferase domain